MNRYASLLITAGIALLAGYYLGGVVERPLSGQAGGMAGEEPGVLYWVAPMDSNFRRDQPGKSPMGMDLVPVYASVTGDGEAVSINPALENSLGVRTEVASIRPLWRKIEATGYVGFDETNISHINLRTQGWIVRLLVDAEGEAVSKGDLLFEIYSPELVNAQKEFLQAQTHGDDRLKRGAHAKLRALGMIPSEIQRLTESGKASENIRIVAPQDGIVTQLSVREGMFVQPNTTIMILASLDNIWLQAEVFEAQSEWVAMGQVAEARMDYMPGVVFTGEVDYVYPVLDPTTRTLRVRLKFDNPGHRMKPNMYAGVTIYGRLRPRALTIPRHSLIRGAERHRVVVSLGDGQFSVHEVLAGMDSGPWVEILAGIEEGDLVVTSAQFLLDSEASLAGSIVRLEQLPEAGATQPPVSAFANGWIEDLDAGNNVMRVRHGPIEQLGWPAMTMDFKTEARIDLGEFEIGQAISFQLSQSESGRFFISRLAQSSQGKGDD